MKVLFLDHDGVICLQNNWGTRFKKRKEFYNSEEIPKSKLDMPLKVRFDDFDKKSILVLNQILVDSGAEIICSSDWRKYASVDEMCQYYLSQGIIRGPIDFTPKLNDFDSSTAELYRFRQYFAAARSLEVKKWLELNKVDNWVAVDDLDMSNENLQTGLDNFVLTHKNLEGIKQTGIDKKILNYLI